MQNILKETTFPISYIDPTEQTNPSAKHYPGFRGNNQLIIYTPKFGVNTKTNEYGQEAVVSNGVVVKVGGSNSFIPVNGYVISGHGTAKKWINNNIKIGSKVELSAYKRQLTVYFTPDSYTFQARQKIQEVKGLINLYNRKNKNYSATKAVSMVNKADSYLNKANKLIKSRRYTEANKAANYATNLAQYALYMAIPSKQGEFKGVWIRPKEKNRAEIAKTVASIKSTGIDNIFLETYYQSYTIFPSKYLASKGIKAQRDEFIGWDPLAVWIEEAHKQGLKVHAWFQTFYAGNDNIAGIPNHVLSVNPNWANVQYRNYESNEPMPSKSEHNGYFLDPANPDVQLYLFSLLKEIVANYQVDGVNIDYIRYPASLATEFKNHVDSTWGYTEAARAEFKSKYKVDPVKIKHKSKEWDKWVCYRQDKVSEFVKLLNDIKQSKDIMLSAVIFPSKEESSIIKLQDWSKWASGHYVDAFTPLIMSSDTKLASEHMKHLKKEIPWNIKVYPGLFEPFIKANPDDMLKQIVSVREGGAQGVIIFDYAHLDKDFKKALSIRAFK